MIGGKYWKLLIFLPEKILQISIVLLKDVVIGYQYDYWPADNQAGAWGSASPLDQGENIVSLLM